MNPNTAGADESVLQLRKMQDQVSILQQPVLSANQTVTQVNSA